MAYVRQVANAAAPARIRNEILRLAHRGLPVAEFSRAVGNTLGRIVPAEGCCLMTVDPATMLPTAEYVENGLPAAELLRLVEIEVREPDFNKWVHLADANRPAASLSAVTEGDLDLSARQREIRRPGGFSDELRVVLASSTGTWGQLTVFREANRPYFTASDVQFVASIAGVISDGLRRDLLLGAGDRIGARLPLVIPAVARQARAVSTSGAGAPARARVRTRTGRWLIVRGSVLGDGPDAPVAVMLEAARPAEMAPLIVDAYGFTDSERRITELVAQGLSTRQIAGRLQITAYTVQDHLKSIFAKSGTGSRGDLVARLFFDHYAAPLTNPQGANR